LFPADAARVIDVDQRLQPSARERIDAFGALKSPIDAPKPQLPYTAALSVMKKFLRNPYLWLCVCVLGSFLLLAYPLYVIRPLRQQGSHELVIALWTIRFRFPLQILLVFVTALLSVRVWQTRRFYPMDAPAFSAALQSKLAAAEQVIAVKVSGSARAYPIRIISYHHIVNDVVAASPLLLRIECYVTPVWCFNAQSMASLFVFTWLALTTRTS
jgi:hypothetical protein